MIVEDVCAAYFGAVGDVFDESISGVKVFLAVWALVALKVDPDRSWHVVCGSGMC